MALRQRLPAKVMLSFCADCVAKRFCASEWARLIQNQGSRRKVDFKNPFTPIRLLRIFILQLLRGDFCNTIGTKRSHFDL